MVRKLLMTSTADKFLEHLEPKHKQIVRKIFALASDPVPGDSIKMVGSDFRRATQGEYRIVYAFDSDTVYIEAVGKRNDDEVYTKARRR